MADPTPAEIEGQPTIHYADPPVLLRDTIDDLELVVGLLERNAPYTPLGGWFRPGSDTDAETSPMWFQKDWVHADFALAGSDLFLSERARHPGGARLLRRGGRWFRTPCT